MKKFLAKSDPEETIQDHTNELIRQFDILLNTYHETLKNKKFFINKEEQIPSEKFFLLLYVACVCHDLGKINQYFQERILKRNKKMNENEIHHGHLSVGFIPFAFLNKTFDFTENEIRVLYETVFYHHKREVKHIKTIDNEIKKLKDPIEHFEFEISETTNEIVDGISSVKKHLSLFEIDEVYQNFLGGKRVFKDLQDEEYHLFNIYIIMKGLLNKIDYAASAHIPVEIERDDLSQKTERYIHDTFKQDLNDLQQYMKENEEKNLIIIASTGKGKTEGSLLWLGDSKGFFTLPLRVSINAIYDRIKDKIGFPNVGLLHSDTILEYSEREEEGLTVELLNQTRLLSYPLTVCTIDQIFDFIFYYEGFEMKAATLSYSKIVIDEIQMYNARLLAAIVLALKKIVELGGKFSIVTATFPPFILELFKSQNIPYEEPIKFIKTNNLGEQLHRHKIRLLQKDPEIEDILPYVENKKILIIVNTVKEAQRLYQDLQKKIDPNISINLLHSRFTVRDRKEKENKILEMGNQNCSETGIWITTQIVEASLDIDFDILFTELSEIGGLFQRLGRVYRNRMYDKKQPNVFVWLGHETTSGINDDIEKSIVDKKIFEYSKEALLSLTKGKDVLLTEKEKFDLVEKVYSFERIKRTDYFEKIKDTLKTFKDNQPYVLEKKNIELREMDTKTIIPYCIYENNYLEIEKLLGSLYKEKNFIKKVEIQKEIMKFTINIQSEFFARFKKLEEKTIELSRRNRIHVLRFRYDDKIGLLFEEDNNCFI